jgi:hypothetical protein
LASAGFGSGRFWPKPTRKAGFGLGRWPQLPNFGFVAAFNLQSEIRNQNKDLCFQFLATGIKLCNYSNTLGNKPAQTQILPRPKKIFGSSTAMSEIGFLFFKLLII